MPGLRTCIRVLKFLFTSPSPPSTTCHLAPIIIATLLGPLGLESRISSPTNGLNLREFGLNLVHQGLRKLLAAASIFRLTPLQESGRQGRPIVLLGALPLMYPAPPGLCPSDRPPGFALLRSSFGGGGIPLRPLGRCAPKSAFYTSVLLYFLCFCRI